MNGYETAAGIAKALGHPARLQILTEIARNGEACVCHLEATLGLRQAYVSQQLARLRDAGLVSDRRDGMNVYYALVDDAVGELLTAIQHVAGALAEDALAFSLPAPGEPCCCPRCEDEPAANAVTLSAERA